jgi:hypothetical protein
MINKTAFYKVVTPGHPKCIILIEYELTNPDEAADLLVRLENSRKFAARLFVTRPKIISFINELLDEVDCLRRLLWAALPVSTKGIEIGSVLLLACPPL